MIIPVDKAHIVNKQIKIPIQAVAKIFFQPTSFDKFQHSKNGIMMTKSDEEDLYYNNCIQSDGMMHKYGALHLSIIPNFEKRGSKFLKKSPCIGRGE